MVGGGWRLWSHTSPAARRALDVPSDLEFAKGSDDVGLATPDGLAKFRRGVRAGRGQETLEQSALEIVVGDRGRGAVAE